MLFKVTRLQSLKLQKTRSCSFHLKLVFTILLNLWKLAASMEVKDTCIRMSDLELKSFSNPPALQVVLEAYVILIGLGQGQIENLFHVAKKVMSQPRLPEVDLDTIPISILKVTTVH